MNRWFRLGLVLVATSLAQPVLNRTQVRVRFQPEPYTDARYIRLAGGIIIDTRTATTPAEMSSRYWLLHFTAPIYNHWLDTLKNRGLVPVAYLAYQTLVVGAPAGCTSDSIDLLCQSLPVDWHGPFLPEYKFAPELRKLGARVNRLICAYWEPAKTETLDLSALNRDDRSRRLESLATRDELFWIQTRENPVPFNRNVQWVLQSGWDSTIPDPAGSRRIWRWGIRGQNMIIGLFDSGINTEHDMFFDPYFPLTQPGIYPDHRKITAYKLYYGAAFGDAAGANYHGSAVAGTLAGEDSITGNESDLEGMAPDARIYFLDIGTASGQYVYSDDLTEMLDSVRLGLGISEPVRQVSGSFGTMDYLSEYRLADASVDAVCWQDKKFLVIWAAGNGGGTRYKLGHPACAKNALTVGGCGNGTRANLIYSLSSAGPTRDNRLKPNLVAPAESIWTVYGGGINAYRVREGTSFAAPSVSGALALLRQYLKEGWYPTGQPDPEHSICDPSSALMRAFAITAADTNVGRETIPDIRTGWGRLNLSRIMHFPDDSLNLVFIDETLGLATGEYDEYEVTISRREPLRVVLAWTDTAGMPNAEIAIVNDLNLELESPDHNRYRGNQLALNQSIPNPVLWDERNVEELIQLARPMVGTWKIRVYARNVYTARQPYALVACAGMQETPGIGEVTNLVCPPTHICRLGQAQILIPPRTRFRLWSITGTLVADVFNNQLQPRYWKAPNISTGVYFLQTVTSNSVQTGKIILLK